MNNLQDKYQSNGFGRIANGISQLGHAIAWGASDVSISGKTGYKNGCNLLWKINKWMVDFTFYPIDGKDHCRRAYLVDRDEKYQVGEGIYQDFVCTLFIWVFCPFIGAVSYTFKAITKFISIFTK